MKTKSMNAIDKLWEASKHLKPREIPKRNWIGGLLIEIGRQHASAQVDKMTQSQVTFDEIVDTTCTNLQKPNQSQMKILDFHPTASLTL